MASNQDKTEGIMQKRNAVLSALSANLLYISLGCVSSWSSASIPHLKKYGLSTSQETWMVSMNMLGSILGPTIASIFIDRIGRKYTLLLSNFSYITGWIILASANGNPYILYIGRFTGGLTNGIVTNSVPIYVTEIADVNMRQSLASLSGPFCCLGLFIEYAAGPWLSYEMINLVSALPSLIFAIAWIRLRESPYHLVAQGRTSEATSVLAWLRGSQHCVPEEIERIEDMVQELKNKSGRKLDLITKKGPRTALLLSGLIFFVQPFSGVDVIASYLDPILSETSLFISHQVATVIIGAVNTSFAFFEPFVVHKFGSKWVMVICSFFCSLVLLAFGIYRYFDERHYNLSSLSAIPIVCIILAELFFGLGYGTLPWAISAELFPPGLKGFAFNIVTTMNCAMAFIVTTLFGALSPQIGISTCFIASSVIFMIGDFLIAIVLPNTQGLSLDKIQNRLEGVI